MLPASRTGVSYEPIRNIDFTSAKSLKKRINKTIDEQPIPPTPSSKKKTGNKIFNVLSSKAWDAFFRAVEENKPVCLSVKEDFNHQFIPETLQPKYPMILSNLYDDTMVYTSKEVLLSHCKQLKSTIVITDEDISNVEYHTRRQADSKLWYRFRTGRVTASRMKAVCSTSCQNPSMSLLKSICYPTEANFSTAATHSGDALMNRRQGNSIIPS
ncbi:hypothetical protein SNE40_014241 [Patella caerulea]|uniref:Uncharacterized protein n=1 Tax=Patella caerulea TaxID=87958 RepID=A0AAN8JDP5_PATCE